MKLGKQLLLLWVYAVTLIDWCYSGSVLDSGKTYLNKTLPNDPGCSEIFFASSFKSIQDISVITSISHSDLQRSVHDPAALWVKRITSRGFTVCVRESGVGSSGTCVVNWIAVQVEFAGQKQGSVSFDQWGSGSQCKTVRPQNLYSKPPQVFATVVAADSSTKQDAMNVWVTKDLRGGAFSVCLREMVNFDGVHSQLKVNWIAYQELPLSMNVTETNKVTIDTSSTSVQRIDYTFCKNVNFTNEFISPPVVLTTASYYSNDTRQVAQECKAINAWIEVKYRFGTTSNQTNPCFTAITPNKLNAESTTSHMVVSKIYVVPCLLPRSTSLQLLMSTTTRRAGRTGSQLL